MNMRGISEVSMEQQPEVDETSFGFEKVADKNQLTLDLTIDAQQEPTHTTHKGA